MDFHDISPIIQDVAKNYRYHKPPGFIIFIQDLITKLMRLLSDFLSSLHFYVPAHDTRMVGNLLKFAWFGAGAIGVLAVSYYAWRRLKQLKIADQNAKRGQTASEIFLNADAWRKQADELAAKKEWKEACRALYFSLLKRLDEKGVVEFMPTRTNYEYWYALARHKPIAVPFRQIANIVESSWFGNRNATTDDYDQCVEFLAQAQAEIDRVYEAAKAAKAVPV
jgi:hypothetical protein